MGVEGVEFIGRFHPIVIHFPIVFVSLLLLVDIVWFFNKQNEFYPKIRGAILYAALITAIAALITGLYAEAFYPAATIESHKTLAYISLAVIGIHAGLWFFTPLQARTKYFFGFFFLSLSMMVLISLTGEEGALIVRDTTPFQTKGRSKYRVLTDNEIDLNAPEKDLRSYLRENVTFSDVYEILDRNKCASCHAEQFDLPDYLGLIEGRRPWLILDEKGNLKDFDKSIFYTKVILKNTMPPKGEVREIAGLNAADRLILLEWLVNNLKLQPPKNSDNEE